MTVASLRIVVSVVGWGFVLGLLAVVSLGLLTQRINARNLLHHRSRNGAVRISPERVQLLVMTLAIAGQYLWGMSESAEPAALPSLPPSWLAMLGFSHCLYLGRKARLTFQRTT
jgi:hypothetical protein